MKQKEIKVLMLAPGEHPRKVTPKNDLDALQKAVSIGCDCQRLIETFEQENGIAQGMQVAGLRGRQTAWRGHSDGRCLWSR